MKNRTIFLSVALCLMLLIDTASAQFTQVWKVNPGTWPLTSNNSMRGAALNRSNGHYLVTNRDVPRIYVFDAATGALLDSLNNAGIAGGGGSVLQDIEVTSDGVVYATNLILNGLTEDFKIYRWADDNNATVPTVAFSGKTKEAARQGDAFDVAGTGTGTVIYVGGNNTATDSVQVFTTTDGVTFTNSGTIRVTGNDAGMGIAQITPGGDFLTSRYAANNPIRLYSGTGAGRLDAVPASVTPSFQADITYLEAAGRKWVASVESLATAGHGHKAVLLNTTYGLSGAVKVGVTPVIGTAANTSSIGGDVELQYNAADSTMTIYLSVDNNGIAAYKTGNLLTTNLAPFAGNIRRTQYVPLNNQNDTVLVDVQDDQFIPKDSVVLSYSVDGGASTVVVMTLVSGDSVKGTYRGVIPASANTNGKRIAYSVKAADNQGAVYTSGISGYFAGTTSLTLAGPRAVDTNGVLLYDAYGIRINGVCIQEDSITAQDRLDAVIQDNAGGINIFRFGTVLDNFVRGHSYTIEGELDQFRGKLELIVPGGGTNFVMKDNGPGYLPKPRLIAVGDLAWGKLGEEVENTVVMIHHAVPTPGSIAWPPAGASGSALNMSITDNGTDSTTMRLAQWGDLPGLNPRPPYTVIGIAGQFNSTTTAPFKGGYQLIPLEMKHVTSEVMAQLKDTTKALMGSEVNIPVVVENITGLGILGYQFDVPYDTLALQFVGASNTGTISAGFTLAVNSMQKGLAKIAASGTQALKDSGVIVNLRFKILKPGTSMVGLFGSFNEGNPWIFAKGGVVIGTLERQIVEVKNSKFSAGVTNVGHIGALNGYQDLVGFMFNGINALYEGSLIMGNAKNKVPNAARFGAAPSWNPGFRHRAPVMVNKVGSKIETMTAFDDSTYSSPLGIWVNQMTSLDTAAGKEGYLLMAFDVINTTASPINNFRLGSFFDFDLTAAGDADRGGIMKDSSNQIPGVNGGNPFKIHLAYIYNGSTFTGVVPLSQTVFAGGRIAVGPNEVYSGRMVDSNKYMYISTFRPTDMYGDGGAPNDMSIFSSVGPYNIPANDTATGAFALVVGNSLNELLNNARAAQKAAVQEYGMMIQILTGVGGQPDQLPTAFALDQNFPNPFNPATTIRFALPNDAGVTLKVYDMLGREIRSLVNTKMNAGFHEVQWNGRNNLGSQVASGMYIYRIEAGSFVSTKKMMLLK
ncbi:MAG: cohesin domain-containing protein [Bacteroidota bacterium]